jgi:hypothetical protein
MLIIPLVSFYVPRQIFAVSQQGVLQLPLKTMFSLLKKICRIYCKLAKENKLLRKLLIYWAEFVQYVRGTQQWHSKVGHLTVTSYCNIKAVLILDRKFLETGPLIDYSCSPCLQQSPWRPDWKVHTLSASRLRQLWSRKALAALRLHVVKSL